MYRRARATPSAQRRCRLTVAHSETASVGGERTVYALSAKMSWPTRGSATQTPSAAWECVQRSCSGALSLTQVPCTSPHAAVCRPRPAACLG